LIQIISTEWGAFSNSLPSTEFDREMEAATINPGEQVTFEPSSLLFRCSYDKIASTIVIHSLHVIWQIFEKTISGLYLGEIVRRVLLKMTEEGGLFGKFVPQKLSTPFILG